MVNMPPTMLSDFDRGRSARSYLLSEPWWSTGCRSERVLDCSRLGRQVALVFQLYSVSTSICADRRSGIYSDRPRLIMAGEIMTKGIMLSLTRYGDL